jgi:hypothetical protein
MGEQIATAATWDAYSVAYARRYGPTPLRDGKVNGQLKSFVKRVGADDGPGIAAHYLRSNNGVYVSSKHDVGLLLRDAAKLRTEWLTGQQGTAHEARSLDKQAGRGDEHAAMLARIRAEEQANAG